MNGPGTRRVHVVHQLQLLVFCCHMGICPLGRETREPPSFTRKAVSVHLW
jgi:hypothetical protein